MTLDGIVRELPGRLEALGFELVELERAGKPVRPVLRLRIDRDRDRERERERHREGAAEGDEERGTDDVAEGVTVADCARVSRALEAWLDGLDGMPARYVLEVSSPGLDRPLTRPRDWIRFAGERVAVKGRRPLSGESTRVEGHLIEEEDPEARDRLLNGTGEVRVRLDSGSEVRVPLADVRSARLVFEWK